MFIKALILNHFDPELYIQIKTDILGHTICGIFSQLILDYLSQWYQMAFFSQKIIFVKIRYKTHNGKLLVIVKLFQT